MAKGKILICDSSDLLVPITNTILQSGDYATDHVKSLADARIALNLPGGFESLQYDAILVDTNLEDGNAFALVQEIRHSLPNLPLVLTSETDIEDHIDAIVENRVTHFLIKPFQRSELLTVADKLIGQRALFGLKGHMGDKAKIRLIRVDSSPKIRQALKVIMAELRQSELKLPNLYEVELLINEMAINALYHSTGHTTEKENRQKLKLQQEHVEIRFAFNEHSFGVSILDFNGTLSLDTIYKNIQTNIRTMQALQGKLEVSDDELSDIVMPSGRGLDMLRKLSGDCYFHIAPGHQTEIIFLFDSRFQKDDLYSPLKVFIRS